MLPKSHYGVIKNVWHRVPAQRRNYRPLSLQDVRGERQLRFAAYSVHHWRDLCHNAARLEQKDSTPDE